MSSSAAATASPSEEFMRTVTVEMLLGLIKNMGQRIQDLEVKVDYLEMMIGISSGDFCTSQQML